MCHDEIEACVVQAKAGNKEAVAKLPKEELELIRMVYFSRATLKAYADKNKLDYSQVYRKRNRILKKLSRCINM